VHKMVDDSSAERKCTGAVPHHFAIPAVLQRADRLLQKPGQFPHHYTTTTKLTL
jgi:hypothetical protein